MQFAWVSLFSAVRTGQRAAQLSLFGIVALVIAQWCVCYFGLPRTEPSVFLHYTVYFGVDKTGSFAQAFWLPGIASAIALLNSGIAYALAERRMRVTILALTCAIESFVLIACILLVIINRSV